MSILRTGFAFFAAGLVVSSTACFDLEDPDGDGVLPDADDHGAIGLTVEGACVDGSESFDGADDLQHDAIRWINCYRNLTSLQTVSLFSDLSLAADRHASYMTETDEFGMVETDPAAQHYSGYDTLERLASAGREVDLQADSVYEAVTSAGSGSVAEPELAIDAWINTVYHRPPLLRPLIDEMGVGFDGSFGDLVTVGPWDTAERGGGVLAARYPAPGQGEIPPVFHSDMERPDPAPDADEVGSPISVTFMAAQWAGNGNHFDVFLEADGCSVRKVGGDELDLLLLEPDTDPYLWATVVLLPNEPLEEFETYQVEIEATVNGDPWVSGWTFTTGAS